MMKVKTVVVTAVLATLMSSGAVLAGKGPGGGGGGSMGQGAQHRYMQGESYQGGQGKAGKHRSDQALQQDRDREQYRGPDAERDKQKAKARQYGK